MIRHKYSQLILLILIAACKSTPPTENERKLRLFFENKLAILKSLEDVDKPNYVELKPDGKVIFYPAYDFSEMFSYGKPKSWRLLGDGSLLIREEYRSYKGEPQKENFIHLKSGGLQVWAEPSCVVPEDLGKVWVFSEANKDYVDNYYLYFFTPLPERCVRIV
ncbi:MAG: hypothetical protein LDLANPLL_02888 [Turneriella sp.]|nr:hypothetical protein [Turneriella sp.]